METAKDALTVHISGPSATPGRNLGMDLVRVTEAAARIDVDAPVAESLRRVAKAKCLGGEIQGRLYPRNDEERQAALDGGYDLSRVLTTDELVSGDAIFAATGISDGDLLQGVRYRGQAATTQSIVMRSRSRTVRLVTAEHHWEKVERLSIS